MIQIVKMIPDDKINRKPGERKRQEWIFPKVGDPLESMRRNTQ